MPAIASTPWTHALVKLHSLKWHDRRIAEALTVLSASAISYLDLTGWTAKTAEAAIMRAEPDDTLRTWNRLNVRRIRQRLNLPANGPGKLAQELFRTHTRRRASAYVTRKGWGALLVTHPDLRPRESDTLLVLWEKGPSRAADIAVALGCTLKARRNGIMAGLVRRGLVQVTARIANACHQGQYAIYGLARGVEPQIGPRLKTSAERGRMSSVL